MPRGPVLHRLRALILLPVRNAESPRPGLFDDRKGPRRPDEGEGRATWFSWWTHLILIDHAIPAGQLAGEPPCANTDDPR
jgi:hypothetical protein